MLLQTLPVGPLGCNCCIVADESTLRAVVVDPGGDFAHIKKLVERSGLKVESILHTHAHIDHVGATGSLQRWTGSAAHMHAADVFMVKMLGVQAAMIGLPTPEGADIQGDLADGGSIDLGSVRIEVMHTPGHSPGSVSLLVRCEQGDVVLSGDTLFAGGIGRTDLWGGDTDAIVRSIRNRLYVLDETLRVIPGHGAETTIGQELRTNPFVRAGHT